MFFIGIFVKYGLFRFSSKASARRTRMWLYIRILLPKDPRQPGLSTKMTRDPGCIL